MLMKRARIALLAGLVLASAPVALRAFEDKAPADKKAPEKVAAPAAAAPVVAAPASCGGCAATAGCGTRTVYVNEWVPENYQTTRTTYKTEWRDEVYTSHKTEYVQETRTRNVTCYVNVQTMEERDVCKYISVPTVETRCVTKRVEVCKPVTCHHRKLVRLGHWECREVASCGSLFAKHGCGHSCGSSCGGCGDCGGCAPACTRTVRKWVHCPEYQDCCTTKMVKSHECVQEQCQVTVCKKVAVHEKVKVCVNKCVPQCKTETYTCCVPKCVAVQCTRKVKHCVPCTETVNCCRMVCHKVAKEVACTPSCNTCGSCDSGCGTKCHRTCGWFKSKSCGCSTCGSGCSTCGGCN